MHLLVGGPARAWNMFLACETTKNLELFEMHSCHWPGARIWLRRKKKKLDTASLLLHYSDGYSFLPYWIEFFVNCVSSFGSNFSRIALWRKRLQRDFQSYLAMNGLILGFFVWKKLFSLTSYRYGLKSAMLAQLSFFLMASICSVIIWRGIRACCLKLFYFSAKGFCQIDWKASRMQFKFNFKLFVSTSLFFCEVVVKFFGYSRKLNRLFFKFCLNCLLVCHLVYSNNCALKDINRVC